MSSIQNFSKELDAALADYSKEVAEGLEEAKKSSIQQAIIKVMMEH